MELNNVIITLQATATQLAQLGGHRSVMWKVMYQFPTGPIQGLKITEEKVLPFL
jgi:hypothetical protein